jgi:hypothetical protein
MKKLLITTLMVFLFGIVNAQSSNSSNSNIAESSDCNDIVNAYELAVRKNITALRKIRNNGYVSNEEFENLQKDIDKWQNIVMKKCAYDPKYAFRVLNIMEQLRLGYNSTFPSIKENSVSNTQSKSNSGSGICSHCQPRNREGHRIIDFNVSTRLYSNERYVQKSGYIVCTSCYGTGLMSQQGPQICNQCNGERFLKCSYCKGTGRKN